MKIYDLTALPASARAECGGKARGLFDLFAAGLAVPSGFVVTETDGSPADLEAAADYFERSGSGLAAVRSSATAEDGEDFSAAGQYATFLNVEGRERFLEAAAACVASLNSQTAESYSKFFPQAKSARMNIVVQKMVDAAVAGVLFTVDPLSGKREIVVEAVSGLGESLVSGAAAAQRYPLPYEGGLTGSLPAESLLQSEQLERLRADALRARELLGYEADMEWAIDKRGELLWLQARPITASGKPDIEELDGRIGDENTVFTRCNVGEMLPGAVTPLSLSTTVRGIDLGLIRMLKKAGAFKRSENLPETSCICSFSGHLFFNLTTVYKMGAAISGADKAAVEGSICGRLLDTPEPPWQKQNALLRGVHAFKYFKFLLSRKKALKKIDRLNAKLDIPYSNSLKEMYLNIDKNLDALNESTWLHYIASAHSGAMSSALLTVLSKGLDGGEARRLLAGLLEDIDGIESVDILRSMRRIARAVLAAKPDAAGLSPEELLVFLESGGGDGVKAAYDSFLKRHGHRAIREAELRNMSWKNDKAYLSETILTVIRTGAGEPEKAFSHYGNSLKKALAGKKWLLKKAVLYLTKQSRAGVYNREYTKSRYIKTVDIFKDAYSHMAELLVNEGALPEKDLVYFLTHKELGDLIVNRKPALVKRALRRRRQLSKQMELRYNDVYIGKPLPVTAESVFAENGVILTGVPLSRGEISGKARVVRSVDDAKLLKSGEIMVAAFTDIGWSPYYSVIGGLVTEVGSTLSHGAVVAREYALPLVANVANVISIIKTGDLIRLNGDTGTVTIVETAA
jgi:pyruvate,water dikinase